MTSPPPAGDDAGPALPTGVEALIRRLDEERRTCIGFPGATDVDVTPVLPVLTRLINNVGDPAVDPAHRAHAKEVEREVVDWCADLFRAPADDRWGYVTNGGTEGNLYALYLARSLFPGALVYASQASHYSVAKAVDVLGMTAVTIAATDSGEMDYDDLRSALSHHSDRPAVVVANVGSTMTESVDDVHRIRQALAAVGVAGYVHADAALAGVPLALLAPADRPGFDLADGADSITISGHKFLGLPVPCGVVVTRRSLQRRLTRPVAYTGSPDTTITGSRNGQAAVLLSYVIARYGLIGLRRRAERARDLAGYVIDRLNQLDWEAWRAHPNAFTVVLKTPPAAVTERWTLATADGWSHLICMPGVTREQLDEFVADLAESVGVPVRAPGRIPRQVRSRPARLRAAG